MGLFSFFKRQCLEVIEWEDSSNDTIVYRYPLTNRDEIMNSSTLVVRPSQVALFIHKGQIADVFSAGTYTLATENIPILTKLLSLPTGFNSKIKAEVYFINTKQFTAQKWGTQNPIMMRDDDFGNVRIRAFGTYSFKVDDPKLFMEELFGTNELYTVNDISGHIKPFIVQGFSTAVAESKISALDLAGNYTTFANTVKKVTNSECKASGIKISSLVIENISLPEEVEKALDERSKLGIMEDKMGTYTQYQAANAMRDAAQNPSGGLAGLGVGLGAGVGLGQIFSDNLKTTNKPKQTDLVECECGAKIKKTAKFCPECGKKQGLVCKNCGATINKTAKFCPECGTSTKKLCPNCKTEVGNKKFCPECGTQVK